MISKVAVVLAIVAVGEGAVTLHLVRQVHVERENAQQLQARVSELEQKAQASDSGATFIAVPKQPATANPFSTVRKNEVPPAEASAGSTPPAGGAISGMFVSGGAIPLPAPDREQMRQQMQASMERQRTMLRDPEYRDAMRAQQRMNLARSNPNLARDLNLTAEQVDRLYDTLAEQSMRSMENTSPMMWDEQPDAAKMQEFHRKAMEQQRANEAELKRTLGDAKFREWQEYQQMAGVRWEADRVRSSLSSAGVPLDENLAKPLVKALHEQQMKMMQQASAAAAASASSPNGQLVMSGGFVGGNTRDALKMQEDSLEMMAAHQKRQRDALAGVLSPEQLKVIEDEHNTEMQMQRAQLRITRAQIEAGVLDPAQGNTIGYIQEGVNIAPSASD